MINFAFCFLYWGCLIISFFIMLNHWIVLVGEATSYLLRNGFMQEQQWFKQSYGSWFLGDYVSEGK